MGFNMILPEKWRILLIWCVFHLPLRMTLDILDALKRPTKQQPRSGWIFSFLVVSVSIAFLVLMTLGRGRQWQKRFGSMNRDVFEIWNTNMWIKHWAWKCFLKYICEILWICYPNMIENLDWTKNKGGNSGAESPTKLGSKVSDFFHQTIGISEPSQDG